MPEEEAGHVLTLIETIRVDDCIQLTYVCGCGAATRRKICDKDFTDQTTPGVIKTAKNGRRAAKE